MKLHEDLKRIIYWVALGMTLVIYAHSAFPEKTRVERMEDKMDKIIEKIDDLKNVLISTKR